MYDSLAELMLEYKRSYERVFHTLKRVKVRARRGARGMEGRAGARRARARVAAKGANRW